MSDKQEEARKQAAELSANPRALGETLDVYIGNLADQIVYWQARALAAEAREAAAVKAAQ